jgi:hypothetical protein
MFLRQTPEFPDICPQPISSEENIESTAVRGEMYPVSAVLTLLVFADRDLKHDKC